MRLRESGGSCLAGSARSQVETSTRNPFGEASTRLNDAWSGYCSCSKSADGGSTRRAPRSARSVAACIGGMHMAINECSAALPLARLQRAWLCPAALHSKARDTVSHPAQKSSLQNGRLRSIPACSCRCSTAGNTDSAGPSTSMLLCPACSAWRLSVREAHRASR